MNGYDPDEITCPSCGYTGETSEFGDENGDVDPLECPDCGAEFTIEQLFSMEEE